MLYTVTCTSILLQILHPPPQFLSANVIRSHLLLLDKESNSHLLSYLRIISDLFSFIIDQRDFLCLVILHTTAFGHYVDDTILTEHIRQTVAEILRSTITLVRHVIARQWEINSKKMITKSGANYISIQMDRDQSKAPTDILTKKPLKSERQVVEPFTTHKESGA